MHLNQINRTLVVLWGLTPTHPSFDDTLLFWYFFLVMSEHYWCTEHCYIVYDAWCYSRYLISIFWCFIRMYDELNGCRLILGVSNFNVQDKTNNFILWKMDVLISWNSNACFRCICILDYWRVQWVCRKNLVRNANGETGWTPYLICCHCIVHFSVVNWILFFLLASMCPYQASKA